MGAPDIYQDAALADITLMCHRCNESLESEDLPEGQPRFADDGWFVALANEAHRRGWLIEHSDTSTNYFDYRILCPKCASRQFC